MVGIEAKHQLVFFAVDGLYSGMIVADNMPFTSNLISLGCGTPLMRTVENLKTYKDTWTPIFHGSTNVAMGMHGMGPSSPDLWQTWIDVLENDFDYHVTLFSTESKKLMEVLGRDDVIDIDLFSTNVDSKYAFHESNENTVIIIHITGLERIGRVYGFKSINYRAYVKCVDKIIYDNSLILWSWIPNATSFFLSSNRGGLWFDNEKFNPDTIIVPFATWGYGVKSHCTMMHQPTETLQIAPTILTMFEYEDAIPEVWIGHSIHGLRSSINYAVYSEVVEITSDLPGANVFCNLPRSVSQHSIEGALLYVLVPFFLAVILYLIYSKFF
jgi:hypothetical protein